MWCHSSPTSGCSMSSQDPSWISPCDSSLRLSQSGAYYFCSHMCSQRARSDPPAQSSPAVPFTRCEIAVTLSRHPEHSTISSCFEKAEKTGNAPGPEEGKGASKPCNNNEHEEDFFSHCPEKWKPFASESLFGDYLEQKVDLADWKTEMQKLKKEEENAFTPIINDSQESPVNITSPGRQHRPENAQDVMQRAKGVLIHTHFDLGDTALNRDSTRMQGMNAGEELEHISEEKIGTGLLHSAVHLIEKQHGADSGEPWVETDDLADSGKDEAKMPPEDTNQSQHIGEYSVCFMSVQNNLS